MPQTVNNMMELASLFNASVNPGIWSYTVALVVIGFWLDSILLPFKPDAMVKTLNKTVEKAYIRYEKHKDVLDNSTTFEDKVNRLQVEALKLQERRLQARDDIMSCCWTDCRSWRCYMRETMAIWVKAHQHQREIVELKRTLKRTIVRTRRGKLEVAIVHHASAGRMKAKGTRAHQPIIVSDTRTYGGVLDFP
ncbi:hypothetical protein IW262DRAFT_1301114 [Armillaria fumosa]|nr:hypothetical protein IW262DRAFT_1301114 [Armillaria fumosa]